VERVSELPPAPSGKSIVVQNLWLRGEAEEPAEVERAGSAA
jgi:hypothetical protein